MRFLHAIAKLFRTIREIPRLASMVGAESIARRMFVTNAFDGLLSALGIILGLYIAGMSVPQSYIGAVAGGSGVMGLFSGFVATYLSERAERLRELRETERVMLHSLEGSVYWRAARLVPIYVAFWSAMGATLPPLLSTTPFILAAYSGVLVTLHHIAASISLILVFMYTLGFYMGKISGENPWLSGLRFLSIGVGATLFMSTLKLIVG
ncbi:protein of unknown function DUF125 transmembrane [Pyrolobus fumarii 1A]|uniref:VIT family protein n=1 Tax=Pyrolobus fumarii (strain DSM 11204 / 1A) TaxID=694429 RepID=G0EHP5_PYRF1|nr:hypothetical protein [Pyrolobus fumarii]AEM39398.1 protein of unknown function DUF125 transmembrane [Pyrolobus fumarii 1A]